MGTGNLGSNMEGLLGPCPGNWLRCWLWKACAGSSMELVYVFLAGVLVSAGPGAPVMCGAGEWGKASAGSICPWQGTSL